MSYDNVLKTEGLTLPLSSNTSLPTTTANNGSGPYQTVTTHVNPVMRWAKARKKTAIAICVFALIVVAVLVVTITAFADHNFGQWMQNHVIEWLHGHDGLSNGAWIGIALGVSVGIGIALKIRQRCLQKDVLSYGPVDDPEDEKFAEDGATE